jgi:hypothetical protein
MAKYAWFCSYDNGASNWKDSSRCVASSRKLFDSPEAAARSARQHRNNSNPHNVYGCTHNTEVYLVDGRSWRRKKKVWPV